MNFFPKNPKFFDYLKHLSSVVKHSGARLAALKKTSDQDKSYKLIHDLEHDADEICHVIFHEADKTFITPIDREDIHLLARTLDDIVDYIENVSSNIVIFKLKRFTPEFCYFTKLVKEATETMEELVGLLSYREKKIKEMRQLIVRIHSLENEGDALMRRSLKDLFSGKKPPLEVIKWKDIYEHLETVLDKCEDTADIVDQVVIKNF